MSNLQIYVQYKQLFCSTGSISSCRGHMNLDDGVRDIKTAAATLEYIASNVPEKYKIFVGLKNCETELSYEIDVQRSVDLTGLKELLKYFLDIPEEHKPTAIHVHTHSEEHLYDIESFLNQHGKTMQFNKSKNPHALGLPFPLKPLVYFAMVGAMTQPMRGYGTLVRDLK